MIFEIRYSDSNSDSIIRFFDSNCLTLFFNSRLRVMEVSRLTSRFKTNRFFNTFFPSRLLIFENQDSNNAKTQTCFRLKSSKLPDSNARYLSVWVPDPDKASEFNHYMNFRGMHAMFYDLDHGIRLVESYTQKDHFYQVPSITSLNIHSALFGSFKYMWSEHLGGKGMNQIASCNKNLLITKNPFLK